jgi:hypothetical protein
MSENSKSLVKILPIRGRGPSSVTLVVAALVLALIAVMAIPVVDALLGGGPSESVQMEGE